MSETRPNAIIVDADVLVYEPDAIDILREGGNTLVIPVSVIFELEKLCDAPDIGWDAKLVIDRIERIAATNDKSLVLAHEASFRSLGHLNRRNSDHQLIAVAHSWVKKKGDSFGKIKLVSQSSAVRLLARDLQKTGLVVEAYKKTQTEPMGSNVRKIEVEETMVESSDHGSNRQQPFFPYEPEQHGKIRPSEGVIVRTDFDLNGQSFAEKQDRFVALRKGDAFEFVPPDISFLGIKPKTINGNGPNWEQHIAMGQLKDRSIDLVFLEGPAGTGKTLLAIAAALDQVDIYDRIVISLPMIHLDDVDRMGFLPGDEQEKLAPWKRPVSQALAYLKNHHYDESGVKYKRRDSSNLQLIERAEKDGSLAIQSLDFIRGMSYHKTFMIIDEAQNLTPHQIKTIITRAGRRTKMVFTGDLDQIDRRGLDRRSSGLSYAMRKMMGCPLVGVTIFDQTVRSELSSFAQQVL